jgi:phage host-nuclease inhibitor protein Gam
VPYRVEVVGRGGLRDVMAEFQTREEAERFVREAKSIDRDIVLEIVEVKEPEIPVLPIVVAVAVILIIAPLAYFYWVSGGRGVLQG